MEPSDLTKKSQLEEDALRELLEEIDTDNEDVYLPLNDMVNILSNLSIPEGPFIDRSVMKCMIIETEDSCNSLEYDKETLDTQLREIRLMFEAMGKLGICRVNQEVFDSVLSFFCDSEETNKLLAESDEAQINDYIERLEEIKEARPDYFEFGTPEPDITCDESCRGTEKVLSREQLGEGFSCTTTTRPNKCLYKDWL